MPPQKKRKTQKKGTLTNATKIDQTPADKRIKSDSASRWALKYRLTIKCGDRLDTVKTVGSKEDTEMLLLRFKAKYPDNTPRISKEDAAM